MQREFKVFLEPRFRTDDLRKRISKAEDFIFKAGEAYRITLKGGAAFSSKGRQHSPVAEAILERYKDRMKVNGHGCWYDAQDDMKGLVRAVWVQAAKELRELYRQFHKTELSYGTEPWYFEVFVIEVRRDERYGGERYMPPSVYARSPSLEDAHRAFEQCKEDIRNKNVVFQTSDSEYPSDTIIMCC